MIKQTYVFIIILFVVSFVAISCSGDDDLDTTAQLNFSTEKVDFTTVFAVDDGEKPIGSITESFMIYNRSSKNVNINSIELMHPNESGFLINVDGVSGNRFDNVDILKQDSLYVFVQINPPASGSNKPILIRDSIRFTTNGHVQYIRLEALGQDVYVWKDRVIDSNTTLATDKAYLITDSLVVAAGATLTVPAGIDLFFHHDALLSVHGTVDMQGSVANPICLRGDRFDNIADNIPYNNIAGQWRGVIIHESSFNNIFNNVSIRSSKEGLTFYSSNAVKPKASLMNVSVQNTSESGVIALNSNIKATNCLFANSAGPALLVIGGKYDFVHCTIANYYKQGVRRNRALYISNYDGGTLCPLSQCNFINCIVYGDLDREYTFDGLQSAQFQYHFSNCLIKGEMMVAPQFINCLWSLDPRFSDINLAGRYDYDFNLNVSSAAIDNGETLQSVLFDINGNIRPFGAKSDIGCYEWHN